MPRRKWTCWISLMIDHCSPNHFEEPGSPLFSQRVFRSPSHRKLFPRYEIRSSKSRFTANRFLFTNAEQENEGNPKMMPPLEKQQVLFKLEVFQPSRMAGCCFVLLPEIWRVPFGKVPHRLDLIWANSFGALPWLSHFNQTRHWTAAQKKKARPPGICFWAWTQILVASTNKMPHLRPKAKKIGLPLWCFTNEFSRLRPKKEARKRADCAVFGAEEKNPPRSTLLFGFVTAILVEGFPSRRPASSVDPLR